MGKSGTTMLSFGMISSILFYAFSSGGCVMYNQLQHYSSMLQTIQTLVQAFLGKLNFQQLVNFYGTFAGYYLLMFLMLIVVIISNMFVSILNEFLAEVGNDRALKKKEYEVVEHFVDTIKSFIQGKKENKVAGE